MFSHDKDNSVQVSFKSGCHSLTPVFANFPSLSLFTFLINVIQNILAKYLCLIWVCWHCKYTVKLYLRMYTGLVFWICAHFAQVKDCYHATLPVTGYRLLSFHRVGNQVPGFPKSAICFLTADSRVADERNMVCFSLFRDRHNFYWQELGDQLGN